MKKNYKVLIVEDYPVTAMEIKEIIIELGLDVVGVAKSNETAIKKFKEHLPDIVLMDINLEGKKDGILTVKDLYAINKTNIVYLTAFSDDETIDKAIKTNPLAYEIKPFNKASLQSTMKIVMLKLDMESINTPASNFDLGYGYSFDLKKQELYFYDSFIKLGQKEIELLLMLIKANGQIITQEQIENKIWKDNFVAGSSIRTLIWRLRTKFEYKIIETVPCYGIRLVLKNKD